MKYQKFIDGAFLGVAAIIGFTNPAVAAETVERIQLKPGTYKVDGLCQQNYGGRAPRSLGVYVESEMERQERKKELPSSEPGQRILLNFNLGHAADIQNMSKDVETRRARINEIRLHLTPDGKLIDERTGEAVQAEESFGHVVLNFSASEKYIGHKIDDMTVVIEKKSGKVVYTQERLRNGQIITGPLGFMSLPVGMGSPLFDGTRVCQTDQFDEAVLRALEAAHSTDFINRSESGFASSAVSDGNAKRTFSIEEPTASASVEAERSSGAALK